MTTVRETKRADELVLGDWTAPGSISGRAAEVLHVLTYPAPRGLVRTHLVMRELGSAMPFDETFDADYSVELAAEAELDELRAQAGRAQKIAHLRALADWLEANPSVPIPYVGLQVSPGHETLSEIDVWNSGAEGLAELRRLAEIMGSEVVYSDERSSATKTFGNAEYKVIAWHKDGRPAEPKPERCETCGESLREIGPGTLGHIPGEICAPTDEVPEHQIARGWKGDGDGTGTCGVECTCGVTYDGFDSLNEAGDLLAKHIEAATSPTGLTKAADQSRGPLAFTTPVVTYFSFGHGQSDPDTGQNLLDHYVTVVAPTYEACREAMFASRFGRAWSFDYLAGTTRATEWIPRWIEHAVIEAPELDAADIEAALKAAREVLAGDGDPFDAQDQAGRGVSW